MGVGDGARVGDGLGDGGASVSVGVAVDEVVGDAAVAVVGLGSAASARRSAPTWAGSNWHPATSATATTTGTARTLKARTDAGSVKGGTSRLYASRRSAG